MTSSGGSPRKTQEIATVFGDVKSLPSAPHTYLQLVEVAARRDSNLASIARVIEVNPALGPTVLQLVNSVFFGRNQRTTTIQQAISRIGVESLKAVVLSAHVFSASHAVAGVSLEQFQAYSLRVARLTRDFVSPARRDEAFTTGLVHDIGKLVLGKRTPDEVIALANFAATSPEEIYLLEREHLGMCHAEAGACLLALWRIPPQIVSAVRYHHQPSMHPGEPSEVLAAVHAADLLIGILTCGEPESRLDVEYLKRAGVADRLPRWRELVLAG